ncbi:uncharacterized protein LOC121971722 [Zingiber officinale]|uniref:Ubiquinone biosynthesis protein n=1 Tax=Zingiber officinale TaxID=94328 RepID=A0A8J5LKQ5_ZINOF|nr:uncharacterized protein LOC121971722 [Zingiber officinale]KAG6516303.1 hypothetical protein ZIOFF_026762 [Zingiber officinale]KAG6516305.1 hypothetical protein ZIOFF_026764 [Zingiber officinale]
MLNSGVATRRLLSALASRSRIAAAGPTSLRGLSSDVPPLPPPRPIPSEEQSRPQKETPEGVSPVEATRIANDDGEARRNGNRSRPTEGAAGKYEETQARVFIAALPHTARLGWTESALIAGARDVGVSPAIVGSIPRKDAALVELHSNRPSRAGKKCKAHQCVNYF